MFLLFLIFISSVYSKKMVQIKQYEYDTEDEECKYFPKEIEKYNLDTCYMDTLMHDNYGSSITFEYCDEDVVKLLLHDDKICSLNNKLKHYYSDQGMKKVNGGCYRFKCIEDKDEYNVNLVIPIFLGSFLSFLLSVILSFSMFFYLYKKNNLNQIQNEQDNI